MSADIAKFMINTVILYTLLTFSRFLIAVAQRSANYNVNSENNDP